MRSEEERGPRSVNELQIEKLVSGGLGLARDATGVVLVSGALPGETVLAEVHSGKGVRRGETREVLLASPDRVPAPDLPLFNLSTADLAHASYPAQLRYKRGFVQEALERVAKLDGEVGEALPSPRQWAYRASAQYLVRGRTLAYREKGGHRAVPIEHDPLVLPAIADLCARLDVSRLSAARELALRASAHTGEVLAALIGEGPPQAYARAIDALLDAGAAGVSLAPPARRRFARGVTLLAGEPAVLERFAEFDLSVSATGFAQVNPAAAGALYRAAARLAGPGGHALDLYGGSGGLAFHLAPHFERVTVLDLAGEALTRGERDAARLGIENVRFVRGDASQLPPTDVVVADPPRAGLAPEVRTAITASGAGKLVYVSCEESTWARDVGELTRAGWTLEVAAPHDFYPQTSHVEVLSLLTRS